ncbi:tRNA glutamyl-Q(34) synthetase GluQRS [Sansalvadorimonas sp. 2012CJ34-2]|uniref:Glutamyl-Q tRNA(Asp) synthetase n=1 Tax=Parendozoicomonas callyspongiae TaxID=2942213 RepID=A0ABT0PK49_9GAMM|nr:tRNA glutamyl-Q(34) synthetase GluQRS [Sansalvadorimonas sp. 2012CJ34-2]MCL6271765.1 tRNA glutamyl-Q(34) synthetase GluQRS [Sansalvadorimonas sp. 2012CJ34-2]
MTASSYTGRFAPSPTGLLHFGSLTAALASYLDARAVSGRWLVRIEDMDPPREQPGASELILKALEIYGLHWDGDVLYQHTRHEAYREALDQLAKAELAYPCTCTRKELVDYLPSYPGFCRSHKGTPDKPHAIRMNGQDQLISLNDRIQQNQTFDMQELGDFVILRKDGLFAYQLAVTVDDEWQGITDIVRGVDLLNSTPRQICLQQALGFNTPRYAHLPVITNEQGEKLSKQTYAEPLPFKNPEPVMLQAMSALGLPVDHHLKGSSLTEMLTWAVKNWDIKKLCNIRDIPQASIPGLY